MIWLKRITAAVLLSTWAGLGIAVSWPVSGQVLVCLGIMGSLGWAIITLAAWFNGDDE